TAFEGAIYYLVHDMIVKALLFLLAGTMIALTNSTKISEMSGLIRNYPLLGWMVFITMLSLAGIQPLSGFIGKVLVGQGTIANGSYVLLTFSFLSTLFVLYSLLRIFINNFWGETLISQEDEVPLKISWTIPCAILVLTSIGLGVGAESIAPYIKDAASTLVNPSF